MQAPETSPTPSTFARTIDEQARRLWAALRQADASLYLVFAALCTLWVGCLFNSSLRLQTLYAGLWNNPDSFGSKIRAGVLGEWSAPLDDVFIHFDFARATARGHPFEWSEGNGYSSGGTSLLYPFVLAVGYRLGFRGLELMLWAGIVASVSVFAVLLGGRRLFSGLPRWSAFLLPPVFLCVGALNWSLWSGMEVALLLAVWVGALLAWDNLLQGVRNSAGPVRLLPLALELGLWSAALVATRPEGIGAVLAFTAGAAIALRSRLDRARLLELAVLTAAPALLVLGSHALANLVMTGDSTAAGALVKLELHHPRLTAAEVFDAWVFHLKYQVLRVTHYHLTDVPVFGWIPWLFAALALVFRSTRGYALLLWTSAVLWVLIVALNGQVRWQNERYTMPALAWLLTATALGLAAVLDYALRLKPRARGALLAAGCLTLSALFVWRQLPRFREQLWFFGRASRNILDQHVRTGRLIREVLRSERVLVGDAGAIPYMADRGALDIIGLGGYRGLPFARATREHVGAAIELIERIPREERPDLLAIYPSWWGEFPLWFGTRVAEVPVRGNVICGGASKVLYQPRWQPLDESAKPFSLRPDERVIDSLDFADLISEREHAYSASRRGDVAMKLLANPARASTDLWDAGRVIVPGVAETFRLRRGRGPTVLVVRAAPTEPAAFGVTVDGAPAGRLELTPNDGWVEQRLKLQTPAQGSDTLEIRFEPSERARTLYHLWAVETP